MGKPNTTLDAKTQAAVDAAVTAALANLGISAQSTPAAVAQATPTFASAGKGMVWFVRDNGSKVKASPKQARAWDNLRSTSKARSAARTPEQRAASQAKREGFLAKAAERSANRTTNREVLAPALRAAQLPVNGPAWDAAKTALAAGKTVEQAVAAARKAIK